MDNLNSHKAIEVQQMISQTGARLLYLPVYSPEFNPIEMMWSVLKNFIRQFHDSPVKNIQSIIQASLLLINPSSFANWFTKCVATVPHNKGKDCNHLSTPWYSMSVKPRRMIFLIIGFHF